MENSVRGYFEDEGFDYPDEIIDERIEKEEKRIDDKAEREGLYEKRRRSRILSNKKSERSNIAQKKKKLAGEEKLGASILSTRPIVYYFVKKTKQELAQAK